MRQNSKNISIKSLEKRKAKKQLEDSAENCEKVIQDHKVRTQNMKFKTVRVPGDHYKNTQFLIREGRDSQAAINRYLESKKYK